MITTSEFFDCFSVETFVLRFAFFLIISVTKLSEFYVTLARNELGEDELKKAQALAQFRDYIDKHPAISNVNISEFNKEPLYLCS